MRIAEFRTIAKSLPLLRWKTRKQLILSYSAVFSVIFNKKAASPIYLFEDSGILVGGGTYNDVVPECYIITMDGLESEHFADVAPYIFEDLGRAYAVVKNFREERIELK